MNDGGGRLKAEIEVRRRCEMRRFFVGSVFRVMGKG
jgi:hypothetical protein